MSLENKKSTKTINEDSGKYTGNSKLLNLGKDTNNFTTPSLSDKTRPGLSDMKKISEKPTGTVNDMSKTPEKPMGKINDVIKTPDKNTPIVGDKKPASKLVNFPLPEIQKRNINQSIHLKNGNMYSGYSRLDLVGDSKSDFNKKNTEVISLFSEPEQFQVDTVEKPTADLQRRPINEISKKNNNLTPTSLPGQNNLVSNTTVQKSTLGQNNLFSNTTVQKSILGQNNLSSDFNKIKPSIGTNNLSSDFSKPRTSIGNNNLSSNFNKPRTSIGKNNLNSNIDTSVKYK